jgi:hypothetical protein
MTALTEDRANWIDHDINGIVSQEDPNPIKEGRTKAPLGQLGKHMVKLRSTRPLA